METKAILVWIGVFAGVATASADMPKRDVKFLAATNKHYGSLCGIVDECPVPLPRPDPRKRRPEKDEDCG